MTLMQEYKVTVYNNNESERTATGRTKRIIDSIANWLDAFDSEMVEMYKKSKMPFSFLVWKPIEEEEVVIDEQTQQELIDSINEMNITELQAYALLHGIVITGLILINDIRQAIINSILNT